MRNGYLPPAGDESQRNSVLQYKIRQLEQQRDALQATVDGLTQFICAAAYNQDFSNALYAYAEDLQQEYKAQWEKDSGGIQVYVERLK